MAVHYCQEHKRAKSFQVNTNVDEETLDELRKRGCTTEFDETTRLWTISSDVPQGRLVRAEEWSNSRLEMLHGCGGWLLFKIITIGAIILAVSLGMGELTAVV